MRSLLLCCLVVGSAATSSERVTLYDRKVLPPTWNFVARASPHRRMHFTFAVKQQNLEQLDKKFWAVSDPKSPDWQNFLSRDEIGQMVASKPEDLETVMSWLKMHLSKDAVVQQTHDAIEVRASAADVEQLFETEVNMFTHDNGHTISRIMGKYSVPKEINAVIQFVEGIADFPMHRSSSHKTAKGGQQIKKDSSMMSPASLYEMYKVPADKTPSRVSQGPAEFQADTSYNKKDLTTFFGQMDQPDEKVTDIVGPYDGTQPDTEATLDVQYMTSMGVKQTNWYWTSENWMYQWAHTFFNHDTVPDAVSISWGWAEDQQCTSGIDQAECKTLGIDSEQFVARTNVEFQKIGLRGVSLFVASGDSGANGRSDGGCTDKVLHASFPAASPYVTAVGATQLEDPKFDLKNPPKACQSQVGFACASGGTEVAVSAQQAGFTSGGGFSTYTPMPAYQKTVVEGYLKENAHELPPASYFNNSKRAYPDVAAMGNNFLVYMESMGGWSLVGGTSASSPTFSGVAAYLNDLSYKKKGKPLGFMNPLLYQMHKEAPAAFTDVTMGNNKCTEDGCQPTCKGYEAAKGWDPVSGLGTPIATEMIAYVEKLLERSVLNNVVV